jgi:hypothetical protein
MSRPVTKSITSGRGNFVKGSPATGIEGCRSGPMTFGDGIRAVCRS